MKPTVIAIIAVIILIGGAFVLTKNNNATVINANNVSVVEGKQIIEIRAKGGYQPRKSFAKAGIPTILRFNTSGTFDCSSSVRIPTLGINQILPQSGITDIEIGTFATATLHGSCGMGMYPFEIEFQS